MSGPIPFTLDGRAVEALHGETIWQAAQRLGVDIPHLCHQPRPGFHPDGNCRLCVVEIAGERVLAASCCRHPAPGMEVRTASERVRRARRTVLQLLLADRPEQANGRDRDNRLLRLARDLGVESSPFPARPPRDADASHPAIIHDPDLCVQCRRCVRACRHVQVNEVIALAGRGADSRVAFDLGLPMGASSCVGCGECVQACPTGALREAHAPRGTGGEHCVETVCPYCGVGCRVAVHVEDGRLARVTGLDGPSNLGRLCVKGRFGMDYTGHAHRLATPLIRRPDAPKSADCHVDPAHPLTHFREATWDEALAYAAQGLARVVREHGPDAVAGFGSAKCSNEEAYLFQKFLRGVLGTNNVDHCARLCHAPSVAGLLEGVGSGGVSAPFTEALNADCILVIGSRPTENHPVAATFFKQAARRGTTILLMDPRRSGLARHADLFLQFRGGTDVALLGAMLHTIVTEGLVNREFIAARTEGYEEFARHILDFEPERMAPVCGIDAGTIRAAARMYARAERAMIFWGMGITQHSHGTDNVRCLIALALATGHIGRPGTGLHPLRGQNNVQGVCDAGLLPVFYPGYQHVAALDARLKFEAAWGCKLNPEPGLTMVEAFNAVDTGRVRAMYIMGENPAMSDPDLNHTRRALAGLDFLVLHDIFLTETAAHADVVFPAAAWLEKTGTATNTNREVQMGRAALAAPGQARPDWRITTDLARAMGADWRYSGPAQVFDEMAGLMPLMANITWERLERENGVGYPCPDPLGPGQGVLFADGFPRPSGRARFVPVHLLPPAEVPDNEYPFALTTGRMLEHWHTGAMSRRSAVLAAIAPGARAGLNPGDMERLGVEPGDMVEVSTRRGSVVLPARLDPDVASGVVFLPFFQSEAAANLLTNAALDPYGKIPEFKFCAARVRKARSAGGQ